MDMRVSLEPLSITDFPNHLSVVCQYALTIMEVSTHGSHAAGMLQMMLQFATSGKDHLTV